MSDVLTREAIDVGAVIDRVRSPGVGGIVLFLGTVRDHAEGRDVSAIDYDAHETLALRALEEVAAQTRERWPGVRVALSHRVGYLEVGEVSVAVAAGAAHRAEAFTAARYAIDTLKERVPIWKKELSADGAEWLHGDERVPVDEC